MQRYHCPGKMIRLLETTTMNGVQCKVRVSNLSESFESHSTCRGLRQGDGLLLSALQHRPGRCHSKRGTRQRRSLQFLGFADVIDIIGRTTVKVCGEAYTRLKREATRIGLRMRRRRSMYLFAGDSDHLGSSIFS